MYEPLDLSDQKSDIALYAPKTSAAVKEISSEDNEVQITATGKTSGKVQVQLDNWCDKVALSYSIKESKKTVLAVDKKTINMNTNAYTDGADQKVTLLVNGSNWTDEAVTVTFPKKFDQKNIVVSGVSSDGKVEDDEITIGYNKEAAPVKGNYTITFKASDGGKASFKIAVSSAKLNEKAVTLKIKTKMDITKKQKMVIEPQLKGIGGEIESVGFEEGSAAAELLTAEYNGDLNQIYVEPSDWTQVSAQNYDYSLVLEVGGVPCAAQLKFKPVATKPAVKIDKITLPKDKVKVSGNEIGGEANVLATYKTGGKTFTIDPEKIEFDYGKGSTVNSSTGYVTLKNGATFRLFFNSEGKLVVEDYQQAKGKASSVKVKLYFPGQSKPITKTFSIKTK